MRILVAGATGKTGTRLVEELVSRGHHPIALVRESSDTDVLPAGVERRRGDLTDLPDDVCAGCDAVDRDGAKRLIDLAAKANVDRFVMLSSVGSGDPDPDSDIA
ncbi:MAG: NAD(P)H-binding protein, partial [Gemmatimonadota bacterium]